MAKLDLESVKKLSKLCRIHCTEEEADKLVVDLQKIIDYVEQLENIDTEGVAPCNHVLEEVSNVMREDIVGETLPRDLLLSNAPDKIGGFIRVPSVLKSS